MVGTGFTPLWRHRQREQFARAVDAHPDPARPGPDDRDAAGGADDETFAAELAVVALLRKAATTAVPDEAAKARMRARVLGAGPPSPTRLDATRPDAARPDAARLDPTRLDRRRPRGGARGRLVVALAAALCLVFSLAGMSLLLSRDALPGDALYGVKRTAESASLGLTFDERSRGFKRLEFAAARITELETLADRYRESGGGPLGAYLTALTDFDADAAAGSRVLTALGSNSDQRTLEELRDWAVFQATRLADLRGSLPVEAADRSRTSSDLLDRIAARASALHARTSCASVTSGQVDEIGPVPDQGECVHTQPLAPGTTPNPQPSTPDSSAAVTPSTPGSAPGTSTSNGVVPPPATLPTSPLTPPDTTTGGPLVPLPTVTLPSLPLPGLGS